MYRYFIGFLSKYTLIILALYTVGVFMPYNISSAQTSDTETGLALAGGADARALFNEAKQYHDGDGVAKDYTKARILYEKSANLGDNDARVNLGYLYFMGQGVEQNYTEARKWYLEAANYGDKSAQENIAMMYDYGLGVDIDIEQAKYWRQFGAAEKQIAVEVKKNINEITTPGISNVFKPISEIPAEEIATIAAPTISNIDVIPEAKITDLPVAILSNTTLKQSNLVGKNPAIAKPVIQTWVSNSLAGFMLIMALMTSIWFVIQFAKLTEQRKAYVFAKAFYMHHRHQLWVNYLRYPIQNRNHRDIDDPWAAALCTLMVRFAEKQHEEQGLVGEYSRKVMQALEKTTPKARQMVFRFVEGIQRKIFDDIEANDSKLKPELVLQLPRQLLDRMPTNSPQKQIVTRSNQNFKKTRLSKKQNVTLSNNVVYL